jgi:hypothetical protein
LSRSPGCSIAADDIGVVIDDEKVLIVVIGNVHDLLITFQDDRYNLGHDGISLVSYTVGTRASH